MERNAKMGGIGVINLPRLNDKEDQKQRKEYGVSISDVYCLEDYLLVILLNSLEMFLNESRELIVGADGENCEKYPEEVERPQCELYRDLRMAYSLLKHYYEANLKEKPDISMVSKAFELIGKHLNELWL